MKASFFPKGSTDIHPVPWEGSWEELTRFFVQHIPHPGPKKNLPAFSPAEFIPHTTRAIQNVVAVHFLVIDLDDVPGSRIPSMLESLSKYDSVIYTTWSCTPTTFKARAIVNISRPVPADSWPGFWHHAIQSLDLKDIADLKCKDAARLYFGPYIPANSTPMIAPVVFQA